MAALLKAIQLVSDSEAVVKISGKDTAPAVIDIKTDILAANQIVYPVGSTPVANIIGFQWAGEPGAIIKIDRNGVRVISLLADNGNFMDFVELFPSEPTEHSSNISVTIVDKEGAAVQGEVWVRIRKVSGYASKIETAVYGVYDDLTQVGA